MLPLAPQYIPGLPYLLVHPRACLFPLTSYVTLGLSANFPSHMYPKASVVTPMYY